MLPIVKENLEFIYGKSAAETILARLQTIVEKYRPPIEKIYQEKSKNRPGATAELNEKTVFLITYPDQIRSEFCKPLEVLRNVADKYARDLINTIHILPFYPYSSDDGFSVIDYYSVNPEFGDWSDIEKLAQEYDLMFDAVINHISSKSLWFQEYLRGNPEYKDFFIEIDDDGFDFSNVFRPRALPLLTEFETAQGRKKIWTTFSADQIDLNYKNPEVLLKVIDLLLFYASKGASFIRLDAIAFLWKQSGTTCVSLQQTHKIVQIFRAILDYAAPFVKIITETNLPHSENISYFGQGAIREADLVYNFPLPPLVLFTLLSKDATKLTRWVESHSLERQEKKKVCYLNFLASHDGIGVTPVSTILDKSELDLLIQQTLNRGGFVSYKSLPDGAKAPYELNINYLDALSDGFNNIEQDINKFIAAHSIMLSLSGTPAVYFHSLFGSQGDRDAAIKSGIFRRINRQKLYLEQFIQQMDDQCSIRQKVYQKLSLLLHTRRQISAFNPYGKQTAIDAGKENFVLLRQSPSGDSTLIAITNISGKKNKFEITLPREYINTIWKSVFSLKEYRVKSDLKLKREINAYETDWLQKILG
ncbi:MAG: sugar phosphorylase [Verrucomicrobiia bacterium]